MKAIPKKTKELINLSLCDSLNMMIKKVNVLTIQNGQV